MLKPTLLISLILIAGPTALLAQRGGHSLIGSIQWLERTGDVDDEEPPPLGQVRLEGEFDRGFGAGLALNYFLRENLSVEGKISALRANMLVRFRTATDAGARIDIGHLYLYPLMGVLQYHVPTSRNLRPYVGIGGSYIILQDIDDGAPLPEGVTRVEVANTVGIVINAGVNASMGRNWFLNVDARYVPIEAGGETEFIGADGVHELRINPLVFSAGLGYRF